ncbi:MAG: hypothetical protein J6S10_01940, partial [Clostridia bacterium]|nr:hypothetical protein [Clostridia bacterium]
ALGHKEEEIPAVDPTYSETGLTAGKKCTVCGEVLVTPETVAKKSAAWIWITVSASVVVLGGGAALLVMKKKNLWIFANK